MNEQQRTLALDVADTIRNLAWMDPGMRRDRISLAPNDELPDTFTMQTDIYSCGAPACIIGWTIERAAALGMTADSSRDESTTGRAEIATELLGLDEDQADRLFFPGEDVDGGFACTSKDEESWISPGHAAACIEHLVHTGTVDWPETYPVAGEAE